METTMSTEKRLGLAESRRGCWTELTPHRCCFISWNTSCQHRIKNWYYTYIYSAFLAIFKVWTFKLHIFPRNLLLYKLFPNFVKSIKKKDTL